MEAVQGQRVKGHNGLCEGWATSWGLVFNVSAITLVDINAAWRMSKLQWTEMACWDRNIFLLFQVQNVSKLDRSQYIAGGENSPLLKKKRQKLILMSQYISDGENSPLLKKKDKN